MIHMLHRISDLHSVPPIVHCTGTAVLVRKKDSNPATLCSPGILERRGIGISSLRHGTVVTAASYCIVLRIT